MKILILLLSIFAIGCANIPPDPFPNQVGLGYLGMEFNHPSGRYVGALDINLTPSNFAKEEFEFIGLWAGTLMIKSPGCDIDKTIRFNQITTIKISDLIPAPMKCTLDLYAYTDQVQDREHNITEHGQVHLNTATNPAGIIVNGVEKLGQASVQRMDGSLTLNSVFQIKTPSKLGYYRITGCDYPSLEGVYDNNIFTIALKDLYRKKALTMADSCDFEINVLPSDDFPDSFIGNISVNVYSGSVIKLEQPNFSIKKSKLTITGASYVLGVSINNQYKIENKFTVPYNSGTVYWVRTVTKNGRKSLMAVQNMQIIWKAE